MEQESNSFNVLNKMVYFAKAKLQEEDFIGAKMVIDSVIKQVSANCGLENPESDHQKL
jgi:hypothetical protein